MIIAAAQINSDEGITSSNMLQHYKLTEKAAEVGAKLIIFPELSLSGYVRKRASELAFHMDDSRLNGLAVLSRIKEIYIVTGAPIRINDDLYIGSVIFCPNGERKIYTKHFLHEGEEEFYISSTDYCPVVQIENQKLFFSICADINYPEHFAKAYEFGATLYLASIFFSLEGMEGAYSMLAKHAMKYSMNILMSNYCGEVWGMKAGGKSACWNKKGELLKSLDAESSGLLIVEVN